MKRISLQRLAGAAVVAGAAAHAPAQPACPPSNFACRQVIVKLQPSQSIEPVNAAYGTAVLRAIPSRRIHLLQLPPNAHAQNVINAIGSDPRVVWVEHNPIQVVPGGHTQSFFFRVAAQQFPEQYSAQLLGLTAAHQVGTGAGAIVAVLDTGLDVDHPLFQGRVAPGGYNVIDGSNDVRDIGNGLDDDGDERIDELTGHGTFVAGLVSLVAPDCRIVPIKVLNSDGVGSAFWLAQGIDAALAAGVGVISISLGANVPSRMVMEAVDDALAQGVIVVASVGNADRQAPPLYPAGYPGVVAVAGTDAADRKAVFSDYGSYVGLSAPAVAMIGPLPGGVFAVGYGTSFAAPLVAGTAAAVRAATGAPRESVTALIGQTTVDIGPVNPAYVGLLGSGRLSAARALVASPSIVPCYANCDGSAAAPALNVNDFVCFAAQFAAASPMANCDGSVVSPVLNVADFSCFMNRFAAGCQ